MAAGTGMQMMGQNQAQKAYGSATRGEWGRQDGYAAEAAGHFDDSLARSGADRTQGDMDQKEMERQAAGEAILADAAAAFSPAAMGDGTNVANRSAQRVIGKVGAKSKHKNDSIAKLMSFGGAMTDQGRDVGRNRTFMNMVASNARNSLNILPIELEAAKHKGSTIRGIGDLLTGVGQFGLASGGGLGSLFGAKNAGKAASAAGKAGGIMIGGAPATATRGLII